VTYIYYNSFYQIASKLIINLREPLKIHFGYERVCFPPGLRREKPGIFTNMPDSPLLASRKNPALSLQKQLLEVPLKLTW